MYITNQKDDLGSTEPDLSDVVCCNEEEGDNYKLIMMTAIVKMKMTERKTARMQPVWVYFSPGIKNEKTFDKIQGLDLHNPR